MTSEITSVAQYSKNNLLIIPQALMSMSDVNVIMQSQKSLILYKNLTDDLTNVEFYTDVPCFVYIKKGREVLTTAENIVYTLQEKQVVFLQKGLNLFSDFVKETESLQAYMLFFDEAVIEEYLLTQPYTYTDEDSYQSLPLFTVKTTKSLEVFFNSIELMNHKSCHSNHLNVKLMEFLFLVNDSHPQRLLPTYLAQRPKGLAKRNLKRLLQAPENFRLTVNDLAHLSGRSISSFNREFKRLYDMPPKQWLMQKRMQFAKEKLQNDDVSVTDVAMQVGYHNVSHFIKAFKTSFNLTPNQVKKNAKRIACEDK